jgi:hypothetical protein
MLRGFMVSLEAMLKHHNHVLISEWFLRAPSAPLPHVSDGFFFVSDLIPSDILKFFCLFLGYSLLRSLLLLCIVKSRGSDDGISRSKSLRSADLPGTDKPSAHPPGDMADAEMKTSHFPSIPFLASRDPTMARWRVRRVSIGTLETPCHRSDSQSRNSNDPFPELSLQERIIQAAAMVSTLSFLEFPTSV